MHSLLSLSLFPVPGTVLTNTVLVGIVALTHIQIAAFLIGNSTLVIFSEVISMAMGDERHERLARAQIHMAGYVFAIGSTFAIFFVLFVLTTVWAKFYVALQQITFWVFFMEALAFIGEIGLLYTLYANWDRLRAHRRARLGMVIMLNIDQWWQFFLIDVIASYMITPATQGINGAQSYLIQVFNPTSLPLTLHRTVGNVALAGAFTALVAGVQYLRVTRRQEAPALTPGRGAPVRALGAMPAGELVRERDREAAYWDFVGQWGLLWAFGATLLQPWVGYNYAKEIQLHAFDGWYQMMYGWISNIFLGMIGLLFLIIIFGTWYFWRRLRAAGNHRIARRHLVALILLVLTALLAVQPAWFAGSYADTVAAHLDKPFWQGGLLDPIGNFFPWKVACLGGLVLIGLYVITSFLHARQRTPFVLGTAGRRSQYLLISLGVCVSLMMMIMGIIRESARSPYLINGNVAINHQVILQKPAPPLPPAQRPELPST
jgi:cytochrome d ubiquinol oxidase subunit I